MIYNFVSGLVPMQVIHLFEFVQVNPKQAQRLVNARLGP
jgi:hypothetical protein